MALHDSIDADISRGKIPVEFSIDDLKYHPEPDTKDRFIIDGTSYASSHINTTPYNYSVSPDESEMGYNVRQGQIANYIRLGNGLFRILGAAHVGENS